MPVPSAITAKLRALPTRPGVYLMRDAEGTILYVGKAKSLRARVRSYFNASQAHSLKTRELVRRVADFETIVVDTEAEALLLENSLIKEHRPRFNISLRDDKTYPYIKVTVQEHFPRVYVTRRLVRDGARYFGPFTSVGRMREALELVKKIHTVRSCRYDLPREAPARPCLDFDIGRCKAPCTALQSEDEYRTMIEEVLDVLSGHTARASARLRAEMAAAAERMDFEHAGELRDALTQLDALEARQRVVDLSGADRDVVGYARDGAEVCAVVLQIREGKLLGRQVRFLGNADEEEDADVLAAFVKSYYTELLTHDAHALPTEILLPREFADRALLEELSAYRGRPVRTSVPRRGEKVHLLDLAAQNARHVLEERKMTGAQRQGERAPDALYELQEALSLAAVPRRIVCFDISHTQGAEVVGAAVCFTNGAPEKSEYRKFRIRGEWGNDDFRSMHEVVSRYFSRRLADAKPMPELVVIDGGKGQLGAARAALTELGLEAQPIISLAKREEEIFTPGATDPIRLPRRSAALRMLQRLRDEAHRFAIGYNRKLRTARTVGSELARIPGVGPKKQRALLERFGSVRALRDAGEAEVARLPGFGPALARTVFAHLMALGSAPPAAPARAG